MCAAQYKNCKHSINLCHHFHDFSIECTWNFFATSHGKLPCDGIGSTVKRLTSPASLQRPSSDQILSAKEMFLFCKGKIEGIKFAYIPSNEIDTSRAELAARFSLAKTIPGTRGYHQFVPILAKNILGSFDIGNSLLFGLVLPPQKANSKSYSLVLDTRLILISDSDIVYTG